MTTTTRRSSDGGVYLPEHVLFGLLLWLPVTSLLRFKLVCKSWRDLIESPNFIYQHHHLEHRPHHLISMERCRKFDDSVKLGIELTLLSGDKFELPLELDLPALSRQHGYSLEMVSYDGIICLYNHDIPTNDVDIHLWNPATKQLRALPQTPTALPSLYDCPNPQVEIGFGFDVRNSDYKVVRLVLLKKSLAAKEAINIRVEVYSLTTDSWGAMEILTSPIDVITSNPGIPFRGGQTYCWLGRLDHPFITDDPYDTSSYRDYFVFSFDFSNEVFGTTLLPFVHSIPSYQRLAFIRDNVTCINPLEETDHFEIWMLNEYGIEESWTKLYEIGPFWGTLVRGLFPKGEFVLLRSDRQVCIYNLVNQEIIDLPIQGPRNMEVVVYKESLISIRRGNGVAST